MIAMEHPEISRARLKELALLKQKKYRLQEAQVVVEGERTLKQLKEYGILPREQYLKDGVEAIWGNVPPYSLREHEFGRICDSDHPAGIAALFGLPAEREVPLGVAFYLDGIQDPGNLGTIFRIAAAFSLDGILLSPDCVEVSSPKVIRASLGSVFQIPFQVLDTDAIKGLGAELVITDARRGIGLKEFVNEDVRPIMIVLGSEAHGISGRVQKMAGKALRIEMGTGMESLNVAVSAGIIAHWLYRG
jgi:TrmH family RNA methyltransferase